MRHQEVARSEQRALKPRELVEPVLHITAYVRKRRIRDTRDRETEKERERDDRDRTRENERE